MALRWLSQSRIERAFGGIAVSVLGLWLASYLLESLDFYALLGLGLVLALAGEILAYRLFRLGRRIADKALWRVRHRMIAVFFFVGVLPVSLGVLLATCGVLLALGPVTAHTLTSEFIMHGKLLEATAAALLWEAEELPAAERPELLRSFHGHAVEEFPGLEIQARFEGVRMAYPEDAGSGSVETMLGSDGVLVSREDGIFVAASAQGVEGDFSVLSMPVDNRLLSELVPGMSIQPVWSDAGPGDGSQQAPPEGVQAQTAAQEANEALPPPKHALDWPVTWLTQARWLDWRTGDQGNAVFLLRTRPSVLWEALFAEEADWTYGIFQMMATALLAAFVGSLLVSFLIAAKMTRTLTRAVNELYVGTEHVNRGEFGYRVPISGSDQISDLSRSFNTMTASVERSIEDSRQRQQLEAELEIAREVQAKLFPARAPEIDGMEVLGVCRPARSVSGDFFDYVVVRESVLALSFGDVSGKGISAALVMASLHSIVRTQLALLAPERPGGLERSAAQVVESANRHLCEGTAPEKFATLFFGAYDARSSTLAYSNAGHLPPLLVRDGEISPLDVNGMIVGAFPQAQYTASAVRLERNDLLVAFTDGITEPENEDAEEFGEDRVRETLRRAGGKPAGEVIEEVMRDVLAWTGGSALQDDMTMLVMRKR